MRTIRIAIAQINVTVGDLKNNRDKIIEYIRKAKKLRADVVVFPELSITGYPPEDLLLKPQFVKDNLRSLDQVKQATSGITAIIGFVNSNVCIHNAAAVVNNRKILYIYHKMQLPNYGVFDEYRYFKPGNRFPIVRINGVPIGINICEDIWFPQGPAYIQALAGAEVIVTINASPYHKNKSAERLDLLAARARISNVYLVYTNLVGGQDELVFDGHSLIVDPMGRMLASGKQFEEDFFAIDLELPEKSRSASAKNHDTLLIEQNRKLIDILGISGKGSRKWKQLPVRKNPVPYPINEEVYHALVLGTRDYMRKNGFAAAVVGLSGGVDSSLVAAVAVAAVGNKNVTGVFMPSPYSSRESREDAFALARELGIRILEIPIHESFEAYLKTLRPVFIKTKPDVTEENLQARIRGNILMALSNKFGWLVLTTGNKSEMSVGYATLYGDMAGGFAVIKDVPKTLVYHVARCVNRLAGRAMIPRRVLTKEPSAELRPNQKDSDSLPPYPVLDPILKAYVEDDLEFTEILKMGFDRRTVERVIRLVDLSEYKRRQAPPGIKITARALGKDRRVPLTNRYKSY